MTYIQLLSEIRIVFMERLESIVPLSAYLESPKIPKSVYLDAVYTDIMSLGYNFNDLKKAVDDIYEIQTVGKGKSIELFNNLMVRVEETANLYSKEVDVFSSFHKMTQEGEDFVKCLEIVRNKLKN